MSSPNDCYVLETPEDYPQWTVHTLGLLQQKCCADAIQPLVPITVNAVREDLVQSGFTATQLTVAMLVEIVHDRKDKQKVRLSKAAGIIIRQVAERHQHLLVKKEPHQMWETLKERFQDASPWSLTNALLQLSRKKMSDYTSAHEYCSAYGKVLSETIGMLREDFHLDPKGIEVIVQGFMMSNAEEIYAPLMAQLRKDWKNGTVDFTEASKAIINYPVTKRTRLCTSEDSLNGSIRLGHKLQHAPPQIVLRKEEHFIPPSNAE
ncbi:hypothetical protein MMC22_005322 [Lobaria immixta]|nr:hypothetical protein [Lobaria immixta]